MISKIFKNLTIKKLLNFLRSFLVGDEGFEPPTPSV
jgi:hypothetical protein